MTDVKAGERDWICAAVDRFERSLTLYAARIVGDEERARDVVQDTFLKMWQADRAEIDGHLAQWLYTVCRNRALDELRRDGRMTALNEARTATVETAVTPAPGKAGGRESVGQIRRLLEGLPPRQQEVIRLKFQGGLSYRQIGEVMDLTVSHVGVLIHTALKTVRGSLESISGQVAASDSGIHPGVGR